MPIALARALLSLVAPPVCVGCGGPEPGGGAVCRRCRSELVPLPDPRCARCGAPGGRAAGVSGMHDRRCPGAAQIAIGCRECRGRALAFERAWAPFAYEGACRRLVGALKLRGVTAVAAFMGAELAERAPQHAIEGTLVPVPPHRDRRLRHGFSQSGELARALGARTGLPVRESLSRAAGARPQVGLRLTARLANPRGSVRLARGPAGSGLAGALLTLVDDVYTTGATLDACAHVLKGAGAERVLAVSFARALRVSPDSMGLSGPPSNRSEEAAR